MRLFLGNLNNTTTESEVLKFFDGYGQVTLVALRGDYGFVVDRPVPCFLSLGRINSGKAFFRRSRVIARRETP